MKKSTPTLTRTPSPDAFRPRFHESAMAQVQGLATYIDDLPLVEGTLHAAPWMSPVANARVLNTDLSATLAAPGVVGVVTAVTGRMQPGRALTAVMPGMAVTEAPAGGEVPAVPVARTVYSRPLSTPRSSIRSSTPRSG